MATEVGPTMLKEHGILQTIKMVSFGIIASRHGVSYRTYGEFVDDHKPNIPVLKDHFCPYFTSWDQSVRRYSPFFPVEAGFRFATGNWQSSST